MHVTLKLLKRWKLGKILCVYNKPVLISDLYQILSVLLLSGNYDETSV